MTKGNPRTLPDGTRMWRYSYERRPVHADWPHVLRVGGTAMVRREDGRILLRPEDVDPALLRLVGEDGWVDVTGLAGIPIGMRAMTAATLIGRSRGFVHRLAEIGELEEFDSPNGALWVRFDPAWSADELRSAAVGRPIPPTFDGFARYRAARVAHGLGDRDPHPAHALAAAERFLESLLPGLAARAAAARGPAGMLAEIRRLAPGKPAGSAEGAAPPATRGRTVGRPQGSAALVVLRGRGHHARSLALGEAVRHLADADGLVDLAALAGQPVHMRAVVAARLLGCGVNAVKNLVSLEQLEGAPDGEGAPWVQFDPSWTLAGMAARYLQNVPAPTSYGEWDRYEAIRRAYGLLTGDPHPDHILDAALAFLTDLGHVERAELTGILGSPIDRPTDLINEIYRRQRKFRRRRAPAAGVFLSAEEFRGFLPPAIAAAAATCYDPADEDDDYDPPPEAILSRLAMLGPFRNAASLFLLRLAGRGVPLVFQEEMVRACERIDDLLVDAGIDPTDGPEVTRLMEGYALRRRVGRDDLPAVVDLTTRTWLSIAQRLEAIAMASPRTPDRDLRPFAPAGHGTARKFKRKLRKRYGKLRKEGIGRRKKLSDAISNRFDFLIAAARRRCDQLAHVAEDALAEAVALMASDEPQTVVGTPTWTLRPDGTYGDGIQVVETRVWKGDALWAHLEATGALRAKKGMRNAWLDSLAVGAPLGAGEIYYQHLGVALEEGTETAEPWFATIFRAGTPLSPKGLKVEHRERRKALIKAWKMPGYACVREGLLSFGQNGNSLYRAAALAGIHLVPLQEFDHAMQIGHLAFRTVAITGCRPHEAMQMVRRKSKWPVLEVGTEARTGWMAIPKQDRHERARAPGQSPERFFMVDDVTYEYFDDLGRLLIRRCHRDLGKVPDVEPAARLRSKCGPAPYVFSMDGVALDNGQINDCARYLLAGIAPLTLHAVRHSSANRGWIEGDDLEAVMERLNQRTLRLAKHYARLTAEQKEAGMDRFVGRRTRHAAFRAWEDL